MGSYEKVGLTLGNLFIALHAQRSHASVPQRSCTGLFIFPLLRFPFAVLPSFPGMLLGMADMGKSRRIWNEREASPGVWVCGGIGSPSPECPSLPLGMASPAQAHTGWHLHYWDGGSSQYFRSPSLCLIWDSRQDPLQRAGLVRPVAAGRGERQQRRGGCAGCWVLQPAHTPGQPCPLLPSPLPSQPCGVCAHWQPTHLAGPTASSGVWPWPHQGWEGLDGAVGLCRWGETEPGGAQFPRAQEPHSNAALASRTGEMARAAGDLLWSLPSVTHTPTPGRGQGQCRQCDVY